jgi:hypothetical protein
LFASSAQLETGGRSTQRYFMIILPSKSRKPAEEQAKGEDPNSGLEIVSYAAEMRCGHGETSRWMESNSPYTLTVYPVAQDIHGYKGGQEASCYECLRNFRNQPFHDLLQRGLARDFLGELLQSAGVKLE